MKAIVCPKCKKDDQIRKVSSIYSEGLTSTIVTGTSKNVNIAVPLKSGNSSYVGVGKSNTTLAGMSQTGLSARLAPPKEPNKEGLGCWWASLLLLPGLAFVIGFFSPIQPKRKTQMAFCLGTGLITYLISLIAESGGIALISIVAGILFLIFYVLGLVEENPNLEKVNIANKNIWTRKMHRWDNLYYCYRNDIVFDPDTRKSATVEEMNNLLG